MLGVSEQPGLRSVFITLKTRLLPLRCGRRSWQAHVNHAAWGTHSRGELVGQVNEETVGQAEVQDVTHAADLVGVGLRQGAFQLLDRLSHYCMDPLGDRIPRNEKPRGCLSSDVGWVRVRSLGGWEYLRLPSLGVSARCLPPQRADSSGPASPDPKPPGEKKKTFTEVERVSVHSPQRCAPGGTAWPTKRTWAASPTQ